MGEEKAIQDAETKESTKRPKKEGRNVQQSIKAANYVIIASNYRTHVLALLGHTSESPTMKRS